MKKSEAIMKSTDILTANAQRSLRRLLAEEI